MFVDNVASKTARTQANSNIIIAPTATGAVNSPTWPTLFGKWTWPCPWPPNPPCMAKSAFAFVSAIASVGGTVNLLLRNWHLSNSLVTDHLTLQIQSFNSYLWCDVQCCTRVKSYLSAACTPDSSMDGESSHPLPHNIVLGRKMGIIKTTL